MLTDKGRHIFGGFPFVREDSDYGHAAAEALRVLVQGGSVSSRKRAAGIEESHHNRTARRILEQANRFPSRVQQ